MTPRPLAAETSLPDAVGAAGVAPVGLVTLVPTAGVAVAAYNAVRERVAPRTVNNRVRRFFGGQLAAVRGHEESCPGYDLARRPAAVPPVP